jgi:hypothetical protein
MAHGKQQRSIVHRRRMSRSAILGNRPGRAPSLETQRVKGPCAAATTLLQKSSSSLTKCAAPRFGQEFFQQLQCISNSSSSSRGSTRCAPKIQNAQGVVSPKKVCKSRCVGGGCFLPWLRVRQVRCFFSPEGVHSIPRFGKPILVFDAAA